MRHNIVRAPVRYNPFIVRFWLLLMLVAPYAAAQQKCPGLASLSLRLSHTAPRKAARAFADRCARVLPQDLYDFLRAFAERGANGFLNEAQRQYAQQRFLFADHLCSALMWRPGTIRPDPCDEILEFASTDELLHNRTHVSLSLAGWAHSWMRSVGVDARTARLLARALAGLPDIVSRMR